MQIRTHPRPLFTVKQFAEKHHAWTQAGLRNLIHHSEDRLRHDSRRFTPANGLAEAGAIIRLGGKVLLDEEAFFEWVAAQQNTPPHI